MTLIRFFVMSRILWISSNIVNALVAPVIQSMPTIQTGQWTCLPNNCSNLLQIGQSYLNISFNQSFTQIPMIGIVLGQYNSTQNGINLQIEKNNINLNSVNIRVYLTNMTQQLSFTWIATTSVDIFIGSIYINSNNSIDYSSMMKPQNISSLQSFLFLQASFGASTGYCQSNSLDTINSKVLISSNTGSQYEEKQITVIVVNTETINQNYQIRIIQQQLNWTNQTQLTQNTFPVNPGNSQNILMGVSTYTNNNSVWNFSMNGSQNNYSSIAYSLSFDSIAIVTIQFLQIEIFACNLNNFFNGSLCQCSIGYYEDLNSCLECNQIENRIFNGTDCTCVDGYYLGLHADGQFLGLKQCIACSYTCATCSSNSTNSCLTCPLNTFRSLQISSSANQSQINTLSLNGSYCQCINGYYDNNQLVCSACSYTCNTCNSSVQCLSCDSTKHRTLYQHSCICDVLFHDNGSSQLCQSDNTKICHPDYYYDNSKICQKCNFSCQTCDAGGCITCPEVQFFRVNLIDFQRACPCVAGAQQNNQEKQCQSICGNGILLQNEECDDGNTDNHDGCSSSCRIEQGYQCNQQKNISSCSLSPILNCISLQLGLMVLNQNLNNSCRLCSGQYFVSDDYSQCIQCNENCDGCTGSTNSQCKKCSQLAIVISPNNLYKNLTCQKCEDFPGLYHSFNSECLSICGDGIVRFDKGEQCDDGNKQSKDGCSSKCIIEPDYFCSTSQQQYQQSNNLVPIVSMQRSICKLQIRTTTRLRYLDQQSNQTIQHLRLTFSHPMKQLNFCEMFNLTIESLKDEQYYFESTNQSSVACQIKLFLNSSLIANQIITMNFNSTLSDYSNKGLQKTSVQIMSRRFSYSTPLQQEQAQTVTLIQSGINWLILLLGIFVLLFGGFDLYFALLDMMTWVDTLYYMNVDYPINIKVFFQYASWIEIFYLPNPIVLNQPTDDYYQPGPQRFNDKGFTGCFLASVIGDIYFCFGGLLIYVLSKLVCQALEKIYQREVQKKQKPPALFQFCDVNNFEIIQSLEKVEEKKYELLLPKFLKPVYDQCNFIRNSSMTIFVKLILLVFLDFQTASMLQIQAGEYTRILFITINFAMAVTFQVCGLYLPFYFYSIINKSPLLIVQESFEQKYSAIYEDILIAKPQGKFYCIFSIVKKTIFIYSLIYFYEKPIFQSVFCCLTCSVNVLLIFFEHPFENKKDLIINLVPEFAIFGSLAVTILFAIDDNTKILDSDLKYKLGWVILFFILSSISLQCMIILQLLVIQVKKRILILFSYFKSKK